MPTCFLVLALPRTGAGCVAGVLHRLGIDMGREISQPDDWQTAHCSADFEELLTQCAPTHSDWSMPVAGENLSPLRDWVNKTRGADWGVKHFMIGHAADAFVGLEKLSVICTARPLEASIASWKSRSPDDVDIKGFYESLISVNKRALELFVGRPHLTVDYDELLANPREGVVKIAEFVGRPISADAASWVDAGKRRHQ